MRTSIQSLIDDANDFELCSQVFVRIVDEAGDDFDVSLMSREFRAVVLVWQSYGIINNRGFNYLFEGSFKGDPQFELTARAFREIECHPAIRAFQSAFDLFPDATVTADIEQRLTTYRSGEGHVRNQIDGRFWDAKDDIRNCLASFIRQNRLQFESLDHIQPNAEERPKPVAPAAKPAKTTSKLRLPHWARVAFAARCARHVVPIFRSNWPNVPADKSRTLDEAIRVAEASAVSGRHADNLDKVILDVRITAGAALTAVYGFTGVCASAPSDGNAAVRASFAAKVAVNAAQAALAEPAKSEKFVMEALSFAQSCAPDDESMRQRVANDLARFRDMAANGNWNDETPIPESVLISLNQPKPWWRFW